MDFEKCDWATVIGVLTRESGEDWAQEAALAILEAQKEGEVIHNPIEYARNFIKWRQSDKRKRDDLVTFVSLTPTIEREANGLLISNAFVSNSDPFDRVAAKEILETIPQILIDNVERDGDTTTTGVERMYLARVRRKVREAI